MSACFEPHISSEDGFTVMEQHPDKYRLDTDRGVWMEISTGKDVETYRYLVEDQIVDMFDMNPDITIQEIADRVSMNRKDVVKILMENA